MDLVAFAHARFHEHAQDLGCAALLVDLETQDKAERQAGFDTQISAGSILDLQELRRTTDMHLICRVDRQKPLDKRLISEVIGAGADELLVAMIEDPEELDSVMAFVGDEIKVGIMVETVRAVANCKDLAALSPSRVFLGLNDLWIERQTDSLFEALTDGTADTVSEACESILFGVGGATHPDMGFPLAAKHLFNEISRLGAGFTFLRRSFFAASQRLGPDTVVAAINDSFTQAAARSSEQVCSDHRDAVAAIRTLTGAEPGMRRT